MEGADALLGGLAGGDKAPVLDAPLPPTLVPMKREHDSTDDFEHLERGSQDAGEDAQTGPRVASQNFLDMERDEFRDPPRALSTADRLVDQLADKFTDSESDADTTGESPLHRAQPPPAAAAPPVQPAPPEPALLSFDPTPVPAPAPAPAVAPREASPEPLLKLSVEPEPKQQPKVEPLPPKVRDPSPPPKPKPAPKPVAHVIEAEVIFCQMGLGESILVIAQVTEIGRMHGYLILFTYSLTSLCMLINTFVIARKVPSFYFDHLIVYVDT